MTHKIVPSTFEDTVEVPTPSELLAAKQKASSVYWKALPLTPGRYKVDIVIKDVNNPDHVGRWHAQHGCAQVRRRPLGHSSLILADQMDRVPIKEIGAGNFVIGDTHVRPRVPPIRAAVPVTFNRSAEPELLDAGV